MAILLKDWPENAGHRKVDANIGDLCCLQLGDVGLLRARKSQSVVYPGVRHGVCVRGGLWVYTRSLAIRIVEAGPLWRCAMVDCCGAIDRSTFPL